MKIKTLCSVFLICLMQFVVFPVSITKAEVTLRYTRHHNYDSFSIRSNNLIFVEEQNFYIHLSIWRLLSDPSKSKIVLFEHPKPEPKSSSILGQILEERLNKPEIDTYYKRKTLDDSSFYYDIQVYSSKPIALSNKSYYTLNTKDKHRLFLSNGGTPISDSLSTVITIYHNELYTGVKYKNNVHPYSVAKETPYYTALNFSGKNGAEWATGVHKKRNDRIELHLFFEDRDPVTLQITDEMRAEWRYVLKPTKKEKKILTQFMREQMEISEPNLPDPYIFEALWNTTTNETEDGIPALTQYGKRLD